jgi:hypothetical protein
MVTLFESLPQVAVHFHLGPWRSDRRQSETEDLILFWTAYGIQPDIASPQFSRSPYQAEIYRLMQNIVNDT